MEEFEENETGRPELADATNATLRSLISCVAMDAKAIVCGVFSLTWIAPDWPVIDELTESVAVTVWDPTVLRVIENVPTPEDKGADGGNTAAGSLLVMATVPA
jgi:hypothetical protein